MLYLTKFNQQVVPKVVVLFKCESEYSC